MHIRMTCSDLMGEGAGISLINGMSQAVCNYLHLVQGSAFARKETIGVCVCGMIQLLLEDESYDLGRELVAWIFNELLTSSALYVKSVYDMVTPLVPVLQTSPVVGIYLNAM